MTPDPKLTQGCMPLPILTKSGLAGAEEVNMDIPPNDGYVLVDEEGNVKARLSRAAVEDNPTIVPFKGLRIVSVESRSIDHLKHLLNPSLWLPD